MNIESLASEMLELSSEQRLEILQKLSDQPSGLSALSKILDATTPEVHRNLGRLMKSGLIKKDSNGNYSLSTYANLLLRNTFPTIDFINSNKQFFQSHPLENIPAKFLSRLGDLESGKKIIGFVKVLEKWKQIHQNSEKFIYNIMWEVPYSSDVLDIVSKKLKEGLTINSIFAENAIVSNEREHLYKKYGFSKFIASGNLVRKMSKKVHTVILLNEQEAAIIFAGNEMEIDMSTMFYGHDARFTEWCHDLFQHEWENSSAFMESKLK